MTSKISFRAATKADLTELLNFPLNEKELFYFFPSASYPLTVEQIEKQLSERHDSTVMLDNNALVDFALSTKNIIGFANFYNVENRNIAFIGNVIIRPDKRGQGLGQKMVKAMVHSGFEQLKLKEVHLSCYNQNTSALLFYKQLGFTPYAIEAKKDFNNQPTALIHLKIKNKSKL